MLSFLDPNNTFAGKIARQVRSWLRCKREFFLLSSPRVGSVLPCLLHVMTSEGRPRAAVAFLACPTPDRLRVAAGARFVNKANMIMLTMPVTLEGAAVGPGFMPATNTTKPDTLMTVDIPANVEGAAVASAFMAPANTIRAHTLITVDMPANVEGAAVASALVAPSNTIRAHTLIKVNMPVTLEDAAVAPVFMAPANTIRAHTLMKVNIRNREVTNIRVHQLFSEKDIPTSGLSYSNRG